MPKVSKARLREYFRDTEDGSTPHEKGRALEDLICYVFEKIPGVVVTARNELNAFESEEIDIAFWNDKDASRLSFLPDILLVECKNWSVPVGSEEISWFDTKLRNRGQSFGVFIAANGITGDPVQRTAAHHVIESALREQRRIVVITRLELEEIGDTGQLVLLIKQKLCELAVNGTSLS